MATKFAFRAAGLICALLVSANPAAAQYAAEKAVWRADRFAALLQVMCSANTALAAVNAVVHIANGLLHRTRRLDMT